MELGCVSQIAQRQHGMVTRHQAHTAGFGRNRLRRLVGKGLLEQVSRRVFRFVGSPQSRYTKPMAGVLDAGGGAVASHLTAASLWGVRNLPDDRTHVTVHRTVRVRGDTIAAVHQATLLPEKLVAVPHDVPLVVPALAVMQVAAVAPTRTAHVLDTLWSKRLLRISEVADVQERFSRQGNTGAVLLRRLLRDRSDDMRPAESGNERRFETISWNGGIRTLRRQVDVGGDLWIGRVDYLDSELSLVVEVHSERYHSSYSAREARRRSHRRPGSGRVHGRRCLGTRDLG